MDLVMFSKKLGSFSIDRLGKEVSALGMDGVDLTVRPGGHIRPQDAISTLPQAVDILESHGLKVPMITTSITDASDPLSGQIFEAAGRCGVDYLKLGYWKYEGFGKLLHQLKVVKKDLSEIQALAEEHGVAAGLHIHAGDYVSGTGCLVYNLLKDLDPEYIGAYIDPGHMVVEGGRSGWKLSMDLLSERTKMVAVKDFIWERGPRKPKTWNVRHVPLSQGMVPWPEVFKNLEAMAFSGPISLHSEYGDLKAGDIISRTRDDLDYIRGITGK